jgi:hypothetical protein
MRSDAGDFFGVFDRIATDKSLRGARNLKRRFPMLQVDIFDAQVRVDREVSAV